MLNGLVFFYNYSGEDLGIAILILTLIVRALMFPLYKKSIKSQREMSIVQPIIKELQQKYANDRQKLTEELVKVYEKHKVNPFSSLLVLLVQLPIIIALYRVILNGFHPDQFGSLLYPFVETPSTINDLSLGFLNIKESKNWIIAAVVGAAQYWQLRIVMQRVNGHKQNKPDVEETDAEKVAKRVNSQMVMIMPFMVGFISYTLPTGLAFYWLTSTLVTILQEWYMIKKHKTIDTKPKS
jgi:YidC/Oxa1 family membrane protein insertase